MHTNLAITRRRPASLDIDGASAAASTKATKPACMDARGARALVLKVRGDGGGGGDANGDDASGDSASWWW